MTVALTIATASALGRGTWAVPNRHGSHRARATGAEVFAPVLARAGIG